MPLINFKVELNLNGQSTVFFPQLVLTIQVLITNSIIFNIRDTKFYIPEVTLSAKDNQKLLKFFSKIFERSVYWNACKTKVRIKMRQRNIDNFSFQILLGLIDYSF